MTSATSIAILVNLSAGAAAGHPPISSELTDLFRAFGCDARIIDVRAGEGLTDAARDASARSSIVVAAGGDGTVSGVAAGVLNSSAALGILPLGTLNHFAKDLHIPLNLREAVEVVATGQRKRVDVGQVNDRVFVNNSSIGIYPDIVQEREVLRHEGHRKWPAMAIATARVLRRYRGVTVRTEVDGRERIWRTPFVFVGNNKYELDGRKFGARATLDDGTLFVCLAPRARTRDMPMIVAQALVGRARQAGVFEMVPATELTIDTRTPRFIRVAVDGEVARMATPLRYRTCPGALHVVVPRV